MLPGSWSAKRAAASAALRKVKLEVRKTGSLCSASSVRRWPVRIPRVARPHSPSSPVMLNPIKKKPAWTTKAGFFALAAFIKRPQAEAQIGAGPKDHSQTLEAGPKRVNCCRYADCTTAVGRKTLVRPQTAQSRKTCSRHGNAPRPAVGGFTVSTPARDKIGRAPGRAEGKSGEDG